MSLWMSMLHIKLTERSNKNDRAYLRAHELTTRRRDSYRQAKKNAARDPEVLRALCSRTSRR